LAIKIVSRNILKKRIGFIYIGLAGSLERDFKKRQKIKGLLLKSFPEFSFWKSKILIDGDQKTAFRSGTDEKDGVVLIAGTGSIAMGWKDNKEAIAGGWDYILGDQGSAFWLGKLALQKVCKDLDGRNKKIGTLTQEILRHLGIRLERDLIKKVYQKDLVETVASLAPLVDKAAQKGDRFSKYLLIRAGHELALSANTVIRKLGFGKKEFPLVVVGGMFKSKIVFNTTRKEILKKNPKVKLIFPREEPIVGALKLAKEHLRVLS